MEKENAGRARVPQLDPERRKFIEEISQIDLRRISSEQKQELINTLNEKIAELQKRG